jgi:hypothetical protein
LLNYIDSKFKFSKRTTVPTEHIVSHRSSTS